MAIDPLDQLTTNIKTCQPPTEDESLSNAEATIQKDRPYLVEPMAGGWLFGFSDEFVTKLVTALSTDNMESFNQDELELWNELEQLGSLADGAEVPAELRVALALDKLLFDMTNCVDVTTKPQQEILVDISQCPA